MKSRANVLVLLLLAGSLTAASFGTADAGVRLEFAYTSHPADIQVWLERDGHLSDGYYEDDDDYYSPDYDVYPAVDDVVLYVRASRSCYATVYVVDTAGYIHVVHPLSPYDDAYLRGGRIYRFYLNDLGFSGGFNRGVAYAYAVCSPVRFSYARYGLGVFGPNFGFRIYGDPYVASRQFYLNLIPAACDLRLITVSHARFYIRNYVRYPSYLCAGWHDYYGVRNYCRGDCSVYRYYRAHVKDPYRVLNPNRKLRHKVRRHTEIARTQKWKGEWKSPRGEFRQKVKIKSKLRDGSLSTKADISRKIKTTPKRDVRAVKSVVKRSVDRKSVRRTDAVKSKVVKSSKRSFVQGKKNIATLRQQLKKHRAGKISTQSRISKAGKQRTSRESLKNTARKSQNKRDVKVRKEKKTQNARAVKSSQKNKRSRNDDAKSSRKAKRGKKR